MIHTKSLQHHPTKQIEKGKNKNNYIQNLKPELHQHIYNRTYNKNKPLETQHSSQQTEQGMSFTESGHGINNYEILLELDEVSPWHQNFTNDGMIHQDQQLPNFKDNHSNTTNSSHSHTLVSTPSRKTSKLTEKVGEDIDMESTLASEARHETSSKVNQFDMIASNVNHTIGELNTIYSQIGYSATEISMKKSEIFQVIEETISTFTSSLRREKSNIENECEWLRQHIKVILAMINDNNGDKCLTLINKGIVFKNEEMYEEGFKEDTLNRLNKIQSRKQNFYANSPFNDSELSEDEISLENQYEASLKNIPHLSLLQSKSKLNSIFLDVLKVFIRSFKKLNSLNLLYLNITGSIGDFLSPNANISLMNSLPNKEEAEDHKKLIDEFESLTKELNSSNKNSGTSSLDKSDDNHAYIISSPRKSSIKSQLQEDVDNQKCDTNNAVTLMDKLRDINYMIVRVIRVLKITKITPDILSNLQKEIDYCEVEVNQRQSKMVNIIQSCLSLINILHLTEDQLTNIQKQFDLANKKDASGNEGYFDSETLKFIQQNPKEFGLMNHHIGYVNRLSEILTKMKVSKQKKWDFYLDSCSRLWDKLGESQDHIESFLNLNSSLTDISLLNFKIELNRLFLKRSEFIESFIVDARQEIEALWTKMYYSNEEKSEFKHFNYDVSDETLDKEVVFNDHERELSRLKEEYSTKEPALTLFFQLNELLADQKFLEESSKDSSRLLSKNSCKILLNEEKIRKNINKNLPKLIETLKAEINKFNSQQSANGQKTLTLNGEDFLEKLLSIESQHLQQRGGKSRVSRNASQQASPRKGISQSLRSSPVKTFGRVAMNNGKTLTMNNRLKGGPTPKGRKPISSILSPIRNQTINTNRRIPPKAPQNTKMRPESNRNFKSEPGSRLMSPIRNRSVERSNSNLSRIVGNQLQPLHSPLLAQNFNSIDGNITGNDIYNDLNNDNTIHSNISRLSPLKINEHPNIYSSSFNKTHFSPVKPYGINESSKAEDKENERSILDGKFVLSPIKVVSQSEDKQEPPGNNRISSIAGADSSTIIGDDYQAWRDERIRQLNGISN